MVSIMVCKQCKEIIDLSKNNYSQLNFPAKKRTIYLHYPICTVHYLFFPGRFTSLPKVKYFMVKVLEDGSISSSMANSIPFPRIFDAVEEVMRMDDLQLAYHRKNGWKYLSQALAELRVLLLSSSSNSPTDQNASSPSHEPHEQDDLHPYW